MGSSDSHTLVVEEKGIEMKSIKFIVLVIVLSYLFSCSDKNQNESLGQKLDTTIVKVDIPLDDNYYDRKYTNRKSKYYITIGTEWYKL